MSAEESTSNAASSIPPEVVKKLDEFNKALHAVEEALDKHFEVKFDQHLERPAMEMARIDVMSLFTLSSLGWCLASLKGEDPNEDAQIRTELNRTKDYHGRLKTLESRKLAPRVNAVAAKNFVRNAIWEIPSSKATVDDAETPNPKRKRVDGGNK